MNAAASAVAAAFARLSERAEARGRGAGARECLLLQLLPAAASILFVLGLLVPAQWRFEPTVADESAGWCMIAAAVVGAFTLGWAFRRAARAACLTMRLEHSWRRRAGQPRPLAQMPVPVFRLPGAAPIVSLIGVRRPRLFLADAAVSALSPDELRMSVAHELAHHRAADNLKRILLACAPSLLAFCASGRRLERRWHAAVEFAADARAAGGDEHRAVWLASALVKVARLAATAGATTPAQPLFCESFYDGTLLRERVARLLGPATPPAAHRPRRAVLPLLCLAACVVLVALVGTDAILSGVHEATETLVRALP